MSRLSSYLNYANAGKAKRAGSWGKNKNSSGYILGCSQRLASRFRRSAWIGYSRQLMIFGVSLGVPTDSIEEVMIFAVSRSAPTDPLEEVMIFGVSQGAQSL